MIIISLGLCLALSKLQLEKNSLDVETDRHKLSKYLWHRKVILDIIQLVCNRAKIKYVTCQQYHLWLG